MTTAELNKLCSLNKTIELMREDLAILEGKALNPGAQDLDGMPHGDGAGRRTEDYALQLAQARYDLEQAEAERDRIQAFLDAIWDYEVRWIMQQRFSHGMSWTWIAMRLGGNNTADGVRMKCVRYLEGHGEE